MVRNNNNWGVATIGEVFGKIDISHFLGEKRIFYISTGCLRKLFDV